MIEKFPEATAEEIQVKHEIRLTQEHQHDRDQLDRQRVIPVNTLADDREASGGKRSDRRIDRIKDRHPAKDVGYDTKCDIS